MAAFIFIDVNAQNEAENFTSHNVMKILLLTPVDGD